METINSTGRAGSKPTVPLLTCCSCGCWCWETDRGADWIPIKYVSLVEAQKLRCHWCAVGGTEKTRRGRWAIVADLREVHLARGRYNALHLFQIMDGVDDASTLKNCAKSRGREQK